MCLFIKIHPISENEAGLFVPATASASRTPSVKSSTHTSRASSVAARSIRSRNKSSRSASVAVDVALQGEKGDGVDDSNDTPMED